ncbi:MAG: glycerophosphodiester phosphodiesterase, partial [Burkholderiaceae bacterium]|nr:glycerophosphodiester phosphodiesterase [Burkholderiaceae bacterium]
MSADPSTRAVRVAPPSGPDDWPMPLWIAHRGAGKLAPENTLAAFRLGAQFGFRAFECDVKLSADGECFLMHDDTLDRCTSGSGNPALQTWSALSQLDAGAWHSRLFAGEPLAHLGAVARFVIRNKLALNLEIKPTPGTETLTGQTVAQQVRRLWAGVERKPLLSSFKPEALAAAREAAPELPRALLVDQARQSWLAEARELGCIGVITHYSLMDAGAVQQIHALGMRAAVYTANDEAVVHWLLANGVDGVITDAVDRFSP